LPAKAPRAKFVVTGRSWHGDTGQDALFYVGFADPPMFRDTIFSFQANFVPALIVTEGGPPPYATTYLPLFTYRNGFEYLRYGYASAATLVMFAMTALIVYLQYRIVKRWRHAFVV
jgi:hypothetical protein